MRSMAIPPVRTKRATSTAARIRKAMFEPGGVVPRDAFCHHHRRPLGGNQPGDPEEQFHEISGADHGGIEGAQQHQRHPGSVVLPVDVQDRQDQ